MSHQIPFALIAFAFADLKKAAQVHLFPEQTLPGKPAGKKNSKKKAAKDRTSEKENAKAAATECDPDTRGGDAREKKRRPVADIARDVPGGEMERGSDTELEE